MTHTLTSELSPPMLHNKGMLAVFSWLAHWMQDRHGLRVELLASDEICFEKEEVRILLFESVRELLFNVVKHANAKTAYLEFHRTGPSDRNPGPR